MTPRCASPRLRSLVAADRAAGSQRAAAALGRVWHAANGLAPIIAPLPPTCIRAGAAGYLTSAGPASVHGAAGAGFEAGGEARTLVVVFSSLGWNGVVRAA